MSRVDDSDARMAGAIEPAIAADLTSTGALRAAINLGNPVLAQAGIEGPAGVTVDLAREIAAWLGVPVSLQCFDAARDSFEAICTGAADIGFLAIEPARQAKVWFSAPYVLIEGVYAVPNGSPVTGADQVDRAGIRIAVNEGSAYDLYLTRSLARAEIVRGPDALELFRYRRLEVVAGIRQSLARVAAEDPELRLLEPRFMEIRQAVAVGVHRSEQVHDFVSALVEELKADGFVAAALARSRQDATVAPSS